MANYPPFTTEPAEPFYPGFKPSTGGGKNTGPDMPDAPKSITPVLKAAAPAPAVDEATLLAMQEEERKKKAEAERLRAAAEQNIHVKFGNIRQAFRYLDVDNSGKIGVAEFAKAMKMWNIDVSDEQLKELIDLIDVNKDGEIEYNEFVDGLSRETVAIAAMGKRGMQSDEAMGVSAFELLDSQLKRKRDKFAPKYVSEKQKFEAIYGKNGGDPEE